MSETFTEVDDPADARRSSGRDMVAKALSLLNRLGEHPHGAAAAELARECQLPLSTAHRLLGSLVRDGFLEFESKSRRYTLGLQVFVLGQSVAQARGLTGMARPILEEVSALTGEVTLMAVREGDQQLYVHSVQGPQGVSVIGRPGTHGPLHCTAQGKVLVAMAPQAVREDLLSRLELTAKGPNCITDRQHFRAAIDEVRTRGWALADQEHEVGIRAVAVPVPGPDGVALAAISTAAPAYRTSIEQLIEYVPVLTAAARRIAVRMPSR
ncbi:IclR family transcriptional regulator [Arthrobacter terrae]|nr:IclR family transcriptional regulator [Arthrobacter terrae]